MLIQVKGAFTQCKSFRLLTNIIVGLCCRWSWVWWSNATWSISWISTQVSQTARYTSFHPADVMCMSMCVQSELKEADCSHLEHSRCVWLHC